MQLFVYKGTEKKLSTVLSRELRLGYSFVMGLLRRGDVRINGARTKADVKVSDGDEITVYADVKEPQTVFEDDNLAIFVKPYGIAAEGEKSLEEWAKRTKGDNYTLCHRLDTNTTGLLLFSKKSEITEAIIGYFKESKIKKKYYAVVLGELTERKVLISYLVKDADKGIVKVYDKYVEGSKKAVTSVFPVAIQNGLTLLDIDLVTGRTHQIRAQTAHIGHPVLGDGKYGDEAQNRKYGKRKQLLVAYKLMFHTDGGPLSYLNGTDFTLDVDLNKFFYSLN